MLVTAHNGSHAVKVMFNSYRASTGAMLGIRGGRGVKTEGKVRHTKSIDVRMATLHNVRYYLDFMADLREGVELGTLADLAREMTAER